MDQPKKCSKCGYEEDTNEPWMPFYNVGERSFCGMCISLALLFLEEYEEVRTQGLKIVTSPRYTCLECRTPASKKQPQILLREQPICIACMSAIMYLSKKSKDELEMLGDWKRKRLN